MEELFVYAILLYEGFVTEHEYNKRLDELFLSDPEMMICSIWNGKQISKNLLFI